MLNNSLSFCSNYLDATCGDDISTDGSEDGENSNPNKYLKTNAYESVIPNPLEFDFDISPSPFTSVDIALPKVESKVKPKMEETEVKPKWDDCPYVKEILQSNVYFEEHAFQINTRVQNKDLAWVGHYRCEHRKTCFKTMQIKVETRSDDVVQTTNSVPHTCVSCYDPVEKVSTKLKSGVIDLTDEMRALADKMADDKP